MKKPFFLIVTVLIIIAISVQFWSVSANENKAIDQNLAYPDPSATIQPTEPLGAQTQPISITTQNSSYPAPENPFVSQPVSTSSFTFVKSYPPPISTEQSGSGSIKVPLNLTFSHNVYLPLLLKPYDRLAAVNHADMFAHDRSSDFPNYGTGCSCSDCTNFISQSLYKGGSSLISGNWDVNNPFEWWYKANYIGPIFIGYTNSNTWSATDWFNTYLFQYPNDYEYRGWCHSSGYNTPVILAHSVPAILTNSAPGVRAKSAP